MLADFFTKPLQGSKFCKFHCWILNLSKSVDHSSHTAPQECVGKCSYAEDAVRVGLGDNPMTILNHCVLKNGSLLATRVTRMTLNNCRQQ
jgi:hypothetical protein